MPKHMITFWKDTGHPALRGKTVELFKISWDEESGEWVRDENGPYWGIEKVLGEGVGRLTKPPEDMGRVEEVEEGPLSSALVNPYNTDVVHLEANGIELEPLDLGEEE